MKRRKNTEQTIGGCFSFESKIYISKIKTFPIACNELGNDFLLSSQLYIAGNTYTMSQTAYLAKPNRIELSPAQNDGYFADGCKKFYADVKDIELKYGVDDLVRILKVRNDKDKDVTVLIFITVRMAQEVYDEIIVKFKEFVNTPSLTSLNWPALAG